MCNVIMTHELVKRTNVLIINFNFLKYKFGVFLPVLPCLMLSYVTGCCSLKERMNEKLAEVKSSRKKPHMEHFLML